MEPNEIVRALQDGNACAECQYHGEPCGCNRPEGTCDAWDLGQEAADCIERLQAELKSAKFQIGCLEASVECLDKSNAALRTMLEASQRRESGTKNELEMLQEAINAKGGTEHYPTEDAYLLVCAALEKSKRREKAAIAILNSIDWVGSGAKGRIEDAVGILRGPEQEGEPTRGTCTTTGHPCCGCAPVCGDERKQEGE